MEFYLLEIPLPKEYVIAGARSTADLIYDDIDALSEKKADNVFVMLGSVDILMRDFILHISDPILYD